MRGRIKNFLVDANVVISNPHFYGTAPEVQKMFPYLYSNAEQHQTMLDIEPVGRHP